MDFANYTFCSCGVICLIIRVLQPPKSNIASQTYNYSAYSILYCVKNRDGFGGSQCHPSDVHVMFESSAKDLFTTYHNILPLI